MATLKISDLSVGDWVRCRDRNGRIEGLEAIRSDERVRVAVESYLGTMFLFVGIEDIEPIPITAEILEKNGWSTDGMYAFLRIDEHRHLEYYYHEHRLRKYYCGVDEWQNHAKVSDITFAVHCYNVHQLQHALRLAGIDKEINL
jgi:hypothetical protein